MVPTLVLIGTGTSVGKTHVAQRLLRALGHLGKKALAYKPVESGLAALASPGESDIARLNEAATFHVKPSLESLVFQEPVSPHVAARMEQREIDLALLLGEIRRAQAAPADLLFIELPGGAFSPFTDQLCCAEYARHIPNSRTLLVASDQLGVLHNVGAATRACAALGLPLHGIVLSAAPADDASVATNGVEIPRVTTVPLLGKIPRGDARAPITPTDPAVTIVRTLLSL